MYNKLYKYLTENNLLYCKEFESHGKPVEKE